MEFIEGPPAPKRIWEASFFIQILSSLKVDITSQQVKFEREFIVKSILMKLP